jgi:hypothetical protein
VLLVINYILQYIPSYRQYLQKLSFYEKTTPEGVVISTSGRYRTRQAFLPRGQKLRYCRRPAGGKQMSAGHLHLDGFESFLPQHKK